MIFWIYWNAFSIKLVDIMSNFRIIRKFPHRFGHNWREKLLNFPFNEMTNILHPSNIRRWIHLSWIRNEVIATVRLPPFCRWCIHICIFWVLWFFFLSLHFLFVDKRISHFTWHIYFFFSFLFLFRWNRFNFGARDIIRQTFSTHHTCNESIDFSL